MRFSSYWLDTSEPFVSRSPELPDGRCDVVVVGGGITGSAAALALAKKGARVVVCEAGTVGQAASGRNGGMCNNGFAQDYASLSQRLGTELANRLYLAFDAGVDGRTARQRRVDRLQFRPHRQAEARGEARALRQARAQPRIARGERGPDTRLVTKAELRDEIGSDRYHGGLLFGKSAGCMSADMCGRRAPPSARAHIVEQAPVLGLKRQAGARTRCKHRSARSVRVRCCSQAAFRTSGRSAGFAAGSCRWAPSSSSPSRCRASCSIACCRRAGWPPTRRTSSTSSVRRPTAVCCSAARAVRHVEPAVGRKERAILRHQLAAVFPELARVRIDYCWGGMVDMTANRLRARASATAFTRWAIAATARTWPR